MIKFPESHQDHFWSTWLEVLTMRANTRRLVQRRLNVRLSSGSTALQSSDNGLQWGDSADSRSAWLSEAGGEEPVVCDAITRQDQQAAGMVLHKVLQVGLPLLHQNWPAAGFGSIQEARLLDLLSLTATCNL